MGQPAAGSGQKQILRFAQDDNFLEGATFPIARMKPWPSQFVSDGRVYRSGEALRHPKSKARASHRTHAVILCCNQRLGRSEDEGSSTVRVRAQGTGTRKAPFSKSARRGAHRSVATCFSPCSNKCASAINSWSSDTWSCRSTSTCSSASPKRRLPLR